MTRTGDRRRVKTLTALAMMLLASPALAAVEFSQNVDRTEVGTEDTFRLTVLVSGAPEGAQVQFPQTNEFEVLSRSQSTQMSYQMGGGSGLGSIKRSQRFVLAMRANRAGTLTLPASTLVAGGKSYRTEAIKMGVKKGTRQEPGAVAQGGQPPDFPDLLHGFPGFPDDFGEPGIPEPQIPRTESDLFLKATIDKPELYVGEQATLALYIYSRVDLSSVDALTMPKLDGFWSEELDSPSQLAGEQKVVGGVPYRVYLVKRRALFPVKPGSLTIAPAEADITTGYLFAGHRVHRKGNVLEVKVKPLPPGGPAGVSSSSVGQWRLTTEASSSQVKLGDPVNVKVVLEGRGNVKNLAAPKLTGPAALKIYEPTSTDRIAVSQGTLGGKRVLEYLVMPQQTGTFTLPALIFDYFDPAAGRYQQSKTEPLAITVLAGAGGPAVAGKGAGPVVAPDSKNQLEANGLRPLRYHADFAASQAPVWSRPYFVPLAVAPVLGWLGLLGLGLMRAAATRDDPATRRKRQSRAARARLTAAEKLAGGDPDAFYAEVERALLHFLEAKLGIPVGGLTREGLVEKLNAAAVDPKRQRSVVRVLEACELGRFAPGGGSIGRERLLDEAEAAMEGWD